MHSTSRTIVMLPFMSVAAILLTLMTIACGRAGTEVLVDESHVLRSEGAARPEWDEPLTEPPERPEEPSVVEVHLDVSYPMAGFLPFPSRRDDLSTFQEVALNVANHMAGVYGRRGGVAVQWRGIGHDLRELPRSPRIRRELFDGRSTRLDLSVERVLDAFLSGRAEAAALVTDMMATGEGTGVTGPLTVANALSEWLRSQDVRSGDFHVGLLGLKAEYWGVTHPTECPPGPPLGCWYDERLSGFRRLDSVARIPAYVLVIGRGADDVMSVLESVRDGIVELDRDIEVQRELLTRRSLGFDVQLSCKAPRAQYALFVDEQQQYHCVRDDPVTLACDFTSGFRPATGSGIWDRTATVSSVDDQTPVAPGLLDRLLGVLGGGENDTAPPTAPLGGVDVQVTETGLEFDLDCSVPGSSRSELALRLDVTGVPAAQTTDWSDWTSERAELGKTTQLDGFLRALRIEPDRYRVELPAILRFLGS